MKIIGNDIIEKYIRNIQNKIKRASEDSRIVEGVAVVFNSDGDDMGIYKVLDNKVYDICYRHGFNVQTKVEKDGSYHAVFLADSRNETVKEAITMLESLGLRKVQFGGNLGDFIHHYSINFS